MVYNSEDEDEAEDSYFKGDILKVISYISSSINTRCDLWVAMEDTKRIFKLEHMLIRGE